MKIFIQTLAILYVLIAFSSCEGTTTLTKTIDNQSSSTLTFETFTIYGDSQLNTIQPKELVIIYVDDQLGNFAGENYTCLNEIDSILVFISGNKTLEKDIMNDNNWMNESKGGRNAKEECTFVVTDEDIK